MEARTIGVSDETLTGNKLDAELGNIMSEIMRGGKNRYEKSGVTYEYGDLYSFDGSDVGYVVDFSYCGETGFAIVCQDNGSSVIAELNTGTHSPYYGKDGAYIYGSLGNYAVQPTDGEICRLQPSANMLKSSGSNSNEVIGVDYYKGKLEYGKSLNVKTSYSTSMVDLNNHCATVAGVIALNYYNVYNNNDILKLKTEQRMQNTFDMNDDTAKQYIRIFYDYMNTNPILGTWGGTLPSGMYAGFDRLIREKGYKSESKNVKTYDQMKASINKNRLVLITSTDYYFADWLPQPYFVQGGRTLSISYLHKWGVVKSHSFVGYGYVEYVLQDINGNTNNIQFIQIADGWGGSRYFNISISNIYNAIEMIVSRC